MSFTNSTPNYGLPQYIGTDKPTYLGDANGAYSTIDTQLKANADAAASATATANTAASAASAASTNATTALNTANSAASEAASATSAAASATATANNAASDASTALRASAANTIDNLAPAYDPTLTYNVGDLVTYIDAENSGKLYKCIVAVTAPEAFNINKWDDVTTSEVYANKPRLIASVNTTPTDTWASIVTSLANLFTIDTSKLYRLVINDAIIYNIDVIVTNALRFSNVNFAPNPARIESTIIAMGSFTGIIKSSIRSDNSVVYTDLSDELLGGSENGTFKIYEI